MIWLDMVCLGIREQLVCVHPAPPPPRAPTWLTESFGGPWTLYGVSSILPVSPAVPVSLYKGQVCVVDATGKLRQFAQ
jgi:hypothetical protein